MPWDKTENCRPQLGRYRNQTEFVAWGTNGAWPLAGPIAPGVFQMPVPRAKLHIAGKPVELMRGLLSVMMGPILDPFMGAATVAVAAHELGLEYVGIEVDPTIFEISCHRIDSIISSGAK